jgi:general stress protein YciG
MASSTSTGKGWHGDSEGHAKAGQVGGRKSPGNFKRNRARAVSAGRLGGQARAAKVAQK